MRLYRNIDDPAEQFKPVAGSENPFSDIGGPTEPELDISSLENVFVQSMALGLPSAVKLRSRDVRIFCH